MNNWFQISDSGWRRINADRSMGHLIREGISNSFDQEDVTTVKVIVQKGHVVIEDDSKTGIPDPELISVIFLTDKEDSPTKRGRKGRGLKELLSVATRAIIETCGYTITFDDKGRTETKNERTIGTRIEVWSDVEKWQDTKEAIKYLTKIIPPKKLFINNKEIIKPPQIRCFSYELATNVITDGIQTTISRRTPINIYEAKKGWLYEMGIPIQEIECPYLVDIQQRVPMNDNRDVVDQYYINTVLAAMVDEMIDYLSDTEIREAWVMANPYKITHNTATTIAARIAGHKAVLSKDKHADDVAEQHGYKVIKRSHLGSNTIALLDRALESSEDVAKKVDKDRYNNPVDRLTPDMAKYKKVVEWFGFKLLGRPIVCNFHMRERDYTGYFQQACYEKHGGNVSFNILCLENDFTKPFGEEAIATMIHEFAHEYSSEHGKEFTEALEKLSGKLAYVLLNNDVKQIFGNVKTKRGKTTFITCIDCGAQREVKVQDVFQCVRCQGCQKKHKNKRRIECHD